MDFLLQLFANGLINGSFYALSAIGLTLVFGLMRVVNFAHGDMYMVGGMLGWTFTVQMGLGFFPSLAMVIAVMAISGWVIERVLIERVRDQGEEPGILLTIGLSIFLVNTALLIFGTAPLKVTGPLPNKPLFLGPVVVTQARVAIVAIAALLVLAAHLVIQHTKLGRAMRATFQDTMAAQLAGIRTEQIYAATFSMGVVLAGVAGMLLGSVYVAQPTIGGLISLKAFVVVIFGGMGSFPGAIVGGLALGLVEAMWGGYVGTGYVDAIGFALVIVMLLVRPYGLFSKQAERT